MSSEPSGRPGRIHPTAIVAPEAELHETVEVGPYSVIGPQVTVGAGTRIGPHVVIEGRTTIGERNRIFQFAAIGAIPQDLKYRGEPSRLVIGNDNRIREFTTIHIGTEGGGGVTTIGDGNLLMNFSHVAHDCRIGNRCILANGATLAGHVVLEDYVIVGGLAAVHQFVRLGESAMLGGGAMVVQDVPPFCIVQGDRAGLVGVNVEGLRRRGFSPETTRAIRGAYRTLFRSGLPLREAAARARADAPGIPEVEHLVRFVETSRRGICRVRAGVDEEDDES
jgi:UDP-N-acetylglucosamine acyltransferase